jgi:hypothetical protein
VILTLPAAREVQPGALAEALGALLAKFKSESQYGDGREECTEAFKQLCALAHAQQMPGDAVQRLFDAATDMGGDGMGMLAVLSQLPQTAGMQAQLSVARLLPLLKKAVGISRFRRDHQSVENVRQLLLKLAAQEVGSADIVALLKTAVEQKLCEAFAALQQLRGFRPG